MKEDLTAEDAETAERKTEQKRENIEEIEVRTCGEIRCSLSAEVEQPPAAVPGLASRGRLAHSPKRESRNLDHGLLRTS